MCCQPASPWASAEPVSPAMACGQHFSLRTKGREVLRFTDISHCFKADKGSYISDFSDFQNIKLLRFHCFPPDDHWLPRVRSEEIFPPSPTMAYDFHWLTRWAAERRPKSSEGCASASQVGVRNVWPFETSWRALGWHFTLNCTDGLFKKRKLFPSVFKF